MAHRASGEKRIVVRNRAEYEALTSDEKEDRHGAFDAIHEMREFDYSLAESARRVGTTPGTVRRYAGDILEKDGARYQATPSDRSYQRMALLSTEGLRDVDTRGSRVRSLVATHWNAIGRFAATGDVAVLAPFEGKRVGGVELATNPDLIEEYLRRGELDIDDIYV
jgi:hypothetical protein